jgi:hypothetical protein
VAEAVLTGEKIEKLPHNKRPALFALLLAVVSRLAKDLFVSNSPGHARDRQGKQKKKCELMAKWHRKNTGNHMGSSISQPRQMQFALKCASNAK